jgi:hypothetical protein
MPERFDSASSVGASSATGAGAGVGAGDGDLGFGFDLDFRGAFTGSTAGSGCASCSGESVVSFASSSVVAYVDGRLGRMSSPACCSCFAYSFLSFAFSIRLRLICMAVRVLSAWVGADGDGRVYSCGDGFRRAGSGVRR